ncbi:hypothetical protein [Spartinivicinus ruber]|uniref:hypothetical protein n=1 Tax=Spartinivicinus ruber TaxID=2683272 RepID=UPI0013D74EB4|nr:hypothetical protein [Spartinivicinus ruber]
MDIKIIADKRCANINKDIACENKDIEQAVDLLNMLDGKQHTLLSIERHDGWELHIGGGPDWFIVTAVSSSGKNLTLLNLGGDDSDTIELCAGGQFADFPKSIVVGKEMAKDAVLNFYEENEKILDWEYE